MLIVSVHEKQGEQIMPMEHFQPVMSVANDGEFGVCILRFQTDVQGSWASLGALASVITAKGLKVLSPYDCSPWRFTNPGYVTQDEIDLAASQYWKENADV